MSDKLERIRAILDEPETGDETAHTVPADRVGPRRWPGDDGITGVNMDETYKINDVEYRRHPNGGGWVPDNATVSPTAFVSFTATIGDYAEIGYSAKIGYSATIGYSAKIRDSAKIGDYATIGNSATIGDSATIGYSATIGDHETVTA